jgi:hypothetical protein
MIIWIAYIGGVVALAAFFSWWILLALALPMLALPGLMRKANVMHVLAKDFDYEFSAFSPQASTLNQMMKTKEFKGLRTSGAISDDALSSLAEVVQSSRVEPSMAKFQQP